MRRVLARWPACGSCSSDRLLDLLAAHSARRGRALPRRLERLALLPQGAQLWTVPDGPPGWALEARGALVAVLPLDAPDLSALVEQHLRPAARDRAGAGGVALVSLLRTAGVSAADAEERLAPWLGKEGPVTVSCLVVDGEVWVRLLARAPSRAVAEAALVAAGPAVREALGTDCYGVDGESLEVVVGALLRERGAQRVHRRVVHGRTRRPPAHQYPRLLTLCRARRGGVLERGQDRSPRRARRPHPRAWRGQCAGGGSHGPWGLPHRRHRLRRGHHRHRGTRLRIAGEAGWAVFVGVASPAGVEVRGSARGGRAAVNWKSARPRSYLRRAPWP